MTSDSSNSFRIKKSMSRSNGLFCLIVLCLVFCGFIFLNANEKQTPKELQKHHNTKLPKRKLPPIIKYGDYSYLITGKELKGFWKVIKWHAYFYVPAKEWNKPVFMKYQWYWFTDDGIIKLMSTQKSFDDDVVAGKLKDSNSTLRYFFLQKGIMQVRSMENSKIHEQWRSAEVFKDIEFKTTGFNFKKGDIIQSLLDETGKVLYVRQMRRIKL